MHRTALTIAKTILFARKLQQHRLDFTTLGDAVAVASVGAGNVILVRHVKAGSDGDRLLIAIDVDKPGQLALLIFRAHALFEFANSFHQPIGIGELFSSHLTIRHGHIPLTQKGAVRPR